MSQHIPQQGREVALQRKVAQIALAGVEGFALAGSGAIREHGVIQRPTQDVDLFTTSQDVAAFGAAVDQMIAELRGSGFQSSRSAELRSSPGCTWPLMRACSSTSIWAWTGAKRAR